MIKIVHIIPALGLGGANMMLYKLLANMRRNVFSSSVVTLLEKSVLDEPISNLGVEVINLNGKRGQIPSFDIWQNLIRYVNQKKPDIVQGWLYHGNLAASFAGLYTQHSSQVVWNIRQSLHAIQDETFLTYNAIRLNAWLSWHPKCIINNAWVSQEQHVDFGFSAKKSQIIPNGFDTNFFAPDPKAKKSLCQELRLAEDNPIVCLVARLHPMKGHATFLEAASILRQQISLVHYLVVGPQDTITELDFQQMVNDKNLTNTVHYLGARNDTNRILSGSDISTLSSSWGEGFPNVLGEAMSCALPCVVTDVGDCARIVGDTGLIVPPKNPQALANAWYTMLSLSPEERERLGQRTRTRIINNYSIEKIVDQYETLYRELVKD